MHKAAAAGAAVPPNGMHYGCRPAGPKLLSQRHTSWLFWVTRAALPPLRAGDLAAAADAGVPPPPEEEAEYAWLPPENIKPFSQVGVASCAAWDVRCLQELACCSCRRRPLYRPVCMFSASAMFGLCVPSNTTHHMPAARPVQGDISGTGEPPVDPTLPLCIAAAERTLVDDAAKKAAGGQGARMQFLGRAHTAWLPAALLACGSC